MIAFDRFTNPISVVLPLLMIVVPLLALLVGRIIRFAGRYDQQVDRPLNAQREALQRTQHMHSVPSARPPYRPGTAR